MLQDMSVAQTACMVRAFIEIGTFQNGELSQLIRLLVTIIKTKRSQNISVESFRMRYYNIEDNAWITVATRLRAIADYLMCPDRNW